MEAYTLKKVPVPEKSIAGRSLPEIHFYDAYRVLLPDKGGADVKHIAIGFLTASPSWVDALMNVRNKIVSLIGLKTSSRNKGNLIIEEGGQIGIFRVLKCSPNEIVLGEDDRHLDFRVSIYVEKMNESNYLTVSTLVYYNNWVGKSYFSIVKRFHKLIVPAMMKRMTFLNLINTIGNNPEG
ncbi:DUF2867 domain-containing protein [Peribacillus sp. SCS-37]|uniref:DUF2867 domain-containing protein n=1 Tax=Paraperibacillus esterisolvens TaxID=3115296 RepID=UPI003905BBEF